MLPLSDFYYFYYFFVNTAADVFSVHGSPWHLRQYWMMSAKWLMKWVELKFKLLKDFSFIPTRIRCLPNFCLFYFMCEWHPACVIVMHVNVQANPMKHGQCHTWWLSSITVGVIQWMEGGGFRSITQILSSKCELGEPHDITVPVALLYLMLPVNFPWDQE